jgi:hypothetical protein
VWSFAAPPSALPTHALAPSTPAPASHHTALRLKDVVPPTAVSTAWAAPTHNPITASSVKHLYPVCFSLSSIFFLFDVFACHLSFFFWILTL